MKSTTSFKTHKLAAFVVMSIGVLAVVISCGDARMRRAMSALQQGTLDHAVVFAGDSDAPVIYAVELSQEDAGTPASAAASEAAAEATGPQADPDMELALKLGFAYKAAPPMSRARSREELEAYSAVMSCTGCHTGYGTYEHTMHDDSGGKAFVGISCVDCHGGNGDIQVARDITDADPNYQALKVAAHVKPLMPELWGNTAANPEAPAAQTLKESADYIRFVNPGDLRAAKAACIQCHESEVNTSQTNMMAHGAMLWQAALYNNGAINTKYPIYGEFYTVDGKPGVAQAGKDVTMKDYVEKGIVPIMYPLPRYNITQPGNILRVFERGGRRRPILATPDPFEEGGKPEVRLSIRGLGTDVRTDPVFLGLQKTRLLDPTLNLFGTNDHPGDFRASGCSACHVVYANDRSPVHSAKWAEFGNRGETVNPDPTIKKGEPGHPIKHQFQKQMPTSTCIVCHVHPGTNVVNSYLGYMWWDNEVDGKFMYPARQQNPDAHDEYEVAKHNPEQAAARGLWGNLYPDEKSHAGMLAGEKFLWNVSSLNPMLTRTQFADFHGHGWVYRAVYKQDRKGNLLDVNGNVVNDVSAANMKKGVDFATLPHKQDETSTARLPEPQTPVHLKDIHLEKGMHCVDCHFAQDMHGDGNLYAETRAAVMEECIDCHGTEAKEAAILSWLKLPRRQQNSDEGQKLLLSAFSGNAADNGMTPEQQMARNRRIISQHFDEKDGRLWQKSALDPEKGWYVVQTVDTINPDSVWAKAGVEGGTHPDSPMLARFAHTVRKDGVTWGSVPIEGRPETSPELALAHSSANMTCYSCHTSWTTACFGCHLPMRANQLKKNLHNEGEKSRNYTNYNFQTLRDDVYMLGIDGTVKGNKIVPIRSSCAVMVSSQDALRQWLYVQQQTVSAEGYSGTAFSAYFPHTVRSVETKQCTDCHLSTEGDNNAIMAQLLLHGTNSVNFVGRFAWVGLGDGGVEAVGVSERNEPQAVFGSDLHQLAYPDDYAKHVARGLEVIESHHHHGKVLDLQHRGEYLYTACGEKGFIAYDIANIDNKGFSERFVTAPVSPLGQRLYVKTKYATSVTSPSTMALDPTRPQHPLNEEKPIHLLYAWLYVTDKYEGLVVIGNKPGTKAQEKWNIGVATLLDGDPENNFLTRALAFNPDGLLDGAVDMELYGTYAYVSCDKGVVVIDLDNPLEPKHVATLSAGINKPRHVQFQFRYGFVVDADGLKVIDVTDPRQPRLIESATLPIADARDIYIARAYAYIAAGKEGLKIVDVTKPEQPRLEMTYDAEGRLVDSTAVRLAMTNNSMFAYVADGVGGLKVVQIFSPETVPTFGGFSPTPAPKLVAVKHTHGPAIALSEGLDRDRAVDESGNQLAVFGRRGARPFNLAEQQKLYLKTDSAGNKSVYTVNNRPTVDPLKPAAAEEPKPAEPQQEAPRRRLPGRR